MPPDSPGHDSITDEQLVALANAGDGRGFELLSRRHRDWAIAAARRSTGSREAALDVAQSAFLWLLDQFPGFELRARMRPVLYQVVRSIAMTEKRRERTRLIHLPAVGLRLATGSNDAADENMAAGERRMHLVSAVETRSDEHREVRLLRFVDDLSLEEIDQALEIPLGTVTSRLHHAVRLMRQALAERPGAGA